MAQATGCGLTLENAIILGTVKVYAKSQLNMYTHSTDVGSDGLGLALEGASEGIAVAWLGFLCFKPLIIDLTFVSQVGGC
jgi:hypothetical protein